MMRCKPLYRFVEPGTAGRRGVLCLTRTGAMREAIRTARRVGVQDLDEDRLLHLWRSLAGAGWRIEEVAG